MSAASMAATRRPISPTGTNVLRNSGHGVRALVPICSGGVSTASAAMPQMPGIRKRQTKKKLVPV